ncbi:hypothetical protein J25TS5_45820 [Paenibacillus faecis]|nr:hypothetical protein J25TS5_45820 [Paenibacillus faecis]
MLANIEKTVSHQSYLTSIPKCTACMPTKWVAQTPVPITNAPANVQKKRIPPLAREIRDVIFSAEYEANTAIKHDSATM